MAELWATVDDYAPAAFHAEVAVLAAERLADDPVALFERASAYDSTGFPAEAAPL